MRRRSLCILAAVAVTGLTWAATIPAASAQTLGTKINTSVGHNVIRGLGSGATFSIASCNSSAPSTVACDVWDTNLIAPRNAIRVWCLAPTAVGGDTLTVSYQANGPRAPVPSTTITVNCRAPRTTKVLTPGWAVVTPMVGAAPYAIVNCTTAIVGAVCQYTSSTITEVCSLSAYANTLPVSGTANVTIDGPSVINGKTLVYPYECK